MDIEKPKKEDILKVFKELHEAPCSRDRAYKEWEIVNFFHAHYMNQIGIILAIAGEMQKHFKENRT